MLFVGGNTLTKVKETRGRYSSGLRDKMGNLCFPSGFALPGLE